MTETKNYTAGYRDCAGCMYELQTNREYPCSECREMVGPDYPNRYESKDIHGSNVPKIKEMPPMPEVKPTPSKRVTILHEAEKCICGQREQDYGSPESNFGIIANLWTDYLDAEVTALDVAMMMVLLKVARIKNGGGTGDSFVDIAGYAACGGEIHESTT